MIEVYIDPKYSFSLLYKNNNLFMWSNNIETGPWEDFNKYFKNYKVKTIKLFEIEGWFDSSIVNKI